MKMCDHRLVGMGKLSIYNELCVAVFSVGSLTFWRWTNVKTDHFISDQSQKYIQVFLNVLEIIKHLKVRCLAV